MKLTGRQVCPKTLVRGREAGEREERRREGGKEKKQKRRERKRVWVCVLKRALVCAWLCVKRERAAVLTTKIRRGEADDEGGGKV